MQNILIVDDEKCIRISLSEILREEGYGVGVAKDAEEAMKLLEAEAFDVVLVDIILPQLSGVDLLKWIKKASLNMPVVMMTGEPAIETASSAMRAGAFDYLTKPIGKELLLKTVTSALKMKALDDDRRLLEAENLRYQENLKELVEERTLALKVSEKKFSELFEKSGDAMLIIEQGKITDCNQATVDLLGYADKKDILDTHPSELSPDFQSDGRKSGEKAEEVMAIALKDGLHCFEWDQLKSNGEIISVEVMLTAISYGAGEKVIHAVWRDITDRKKAEKERQQSEADRKQLIGAIEQAGEIFIITDVDGTIQYVNAAFERITGYTRKEAIGQKPNILKSGQYDVGFYQEMWDTLLGGDSWRGQLVNRKQDGSFYTAEMVISPVRNASGKTINFVTVQRDVTEEIKLEAQFFQAQKMESVGRLAGGVAHDFNNMLGVILGHTEMALSAIDPSQPLHGNLSEICKAAERSAALTQQLLAFARKQTISPKALNLNETIPSMLNMLQRLIGEDVELTWLPEEEACPIKMDPSQIDQILTNLCINARDAIEGVGQVTIETANVTFDENSVTLHPEIPPGEYVLLAVSDNGCGMDKATLEKIYEPFYTTKEAGKGTGLGLATVFGIVKQNGDFINVYSEPDVGTTFKIYLHRYEMEAQETQKEVSVEPDTQGGETILLVEDEPAMLDMLTEIFDCYGYTVLVAMTPDEAIQLASQATDQIHLLVTDVVMPEMNGWDLAQIILDRLPDLKCLFMSGYTASVIARHGVLDDNVHFIQKPFMMKELAAKVREVLESE